MSAASGPTALELYLVRHAVAEERGPKFPDDALRPLTDAGIARFRRVVAGARHLGLELDLVLSSPFVRARDTADILRAGLRPKPAVVLVDALRPGRKPAEVIAEVGRQAATAPGATRIALVGHEPELGELAARLLGARGTIEFKKGAVARIDVSRAMPAGPGTLRWLLPPRVLRGLAP